MLLFYKTKQYSYVLPVNYTTPDRVNKLATLTFWGSAPKVGVGVHKLYFTS